ncbi:glycosyltransferase family 4 protein [Burkholderia dolosa]|uniref:Glycosyltransferase family 4 protein n=1 Tax=Burkholderia dolosa TaxID=152500 RepID=A0A892HUZ8_9BURK|nr:MULTISPECIES: glycosyltransferase family 4 protein [Burkholderia]AKE04403.1 glycosyl transferase [Burkholderia cepacia]AJY14478.1 glycosyl transferase 4 family protein [Burkholderia dolosa AU0158]AYZ96351.1 glycosyltransferase family 4 protein [Burkholderia dolosa]EAY69548.1 UDP-N-acetylmuramyl pentapeptide phosphotransferase/UDP-N-acetylglucosamine-1-phosphate transferase [Burkholderia dolosa AU0158]ETP66214.1 glycosyl transferase [Burkholderia dolosa PC543]
MLLANSTWLTAAAVAVAAAFASTMILRSLLATGLAWRLATDIPNDRSLHTLPTPRVGGWGIVPVGVVALAALAPHLWLIAAAAAGLAAMSQIDDRRGLPARVRFSAHLAAVVALIAVYPADAPWWLLAGVGFAMVWLTNLYNFMDGADGLAGGMALFGFGAYAAAALLRVHPSTELALGAAAIAGAALGFLLLNFHPARLFLGDAGSIPLGFMAGALGYWGWRTGVWPIWFPALVFSPFIADASVTLLRRLLRGEKFWQAHREHYYQRMVRSGMGHGRTALYWYLIMLAGIIVALWAKGRPELQQWLSFFAWYGVLACIGLVIDMRWRRFQSAAENNS